MSHDTVCCRLRFAQDLPSKVHTNLEHDIVAKRLPLLDGRPRFQFSSMMAEELEGNFSNIQESSVLRTQSFA